MPPICYPANGVPWLVWVDRHGWHCEACGCAGALPPLTTVAAFARVLGDLKRRHYPCGGCEIHRGYDAGELIGHPLNPDRAER